MSFQFIGSGNSNGGRLQDDSMDGQFPSLHLPTANFSHVSQSSLVSTQFISANQANVVNQNDIFSIGNVLGQLRLNHRVTEIKTAIVSQNRVQVHSVVDYEPLPTQQALPLSEVNGEAHCNGSGLSRTQLLSALSTRERMSTLPKNGFCGLTQKQPVTRSIDKTQALNPYHGNDIPSEAFSFYQNPSRNQPPVFQNNPEGFEYRGNGVIACPPLSSRFPDPEEFEYKGDGVISCSPISVRFPDPESDEEVNSHPSTDPKLRNRKNGARLKHNQAKAHIPKFHPGVTNLAPQVVRQNNWERKYSNRQDYKKGGPYQCRRCSSVFDKCQSYAAHMASHYKTEDREERKKRQASKYKNKSKLLLVQTSNGLTMLPKSFQMTDDMLEILRTDGANEKPRGETKGKEGVKEEEPFFMDVEEPIVVAKEEPN